MDLYAIRRRSAWANAGELQVAAAKSSRIGNDEMPIASAGYAAMSSTSQTEG